MFVQAFVHCLPSPKCNCRPSKRRLKCLGTLGAIGVNAVNKTLYNINLILMPSSVLRPAVVVAVLRPSENVDR